MSATTIMFDQFFFSCFVSTHQCWSGCGCLSLFHYRCAGCYYLQHCSIWLRGTAWESSYLHSVMCHPAVRHQCKESPHDSSTPLQGNMPRIIKTKNDFRLFLLRLCEELLGEFRCWTCAESFWHSVSFFVGIEGLNAWNNSWMTHILAVFPSY